MAEQSNEQNRSYFATRKEGFKSMKKVLSVLLALSLLIATAGCGAKDDSASNTSENQTTQEDTKAPSDDEKYEKKVYTNTLQGVTMELTYYVDGDKVVKQTARNTIKYKDAGQTKDQLKAVLDAASQAYQNIPGVEESIEYGDEEAVETLTVDYTKVDLTKLQGVPGVSFDEDALKAKAVSMKKTQALLEQSGFKLQK